MDRGGKMYQYNEEQMDEETLLWRKNMKDLIQIHAYSLKFFYFDFFNYLARDSDYKTFKEAQLLFTGAILDEIHEKYADHIEGLQKEIKG